MKRWITADQNENETIIEGYEANPRETTRWRIGKLTERPAQLAQETRESGAFIKTFYTKPAWEADEDIMEFIDAQDKIRTTTRAIALPHIRARWIARGPDRMTPDRLIRVKKKQRQ